MYDTDVPIEIFVDVSNYSFNACLMMVFKYMNLCE